MALHTGLKFKTSTSINTIEDWLDNNCEGEWDVEIEAISTALQQKSVAVYFESEADRDAFKAIYKDLK
jgi:hypothetical protein